jgi:hypothetical protein
MGRMAEDSGFDSWQKQEYFFTLSEVQPVSYAMGTTGSFSMGKEVGARS